MRPQPRRGLTLTEVLVAMFVMALGLMALATLFPLGALQVGQALKDDRTAQVAQHADAWTRVYWRDMAGPLVNPSGEPLPGDPLLASLDDANVAGMGLAVSAGGPPYTKSTVYTAPGSATAAVLLPFGNTLTPDTSVQTTFTQVPTGLRQSGDTYNVTDNRLTGQPLPNPEGPRNGTLQRFVRPGTRTAVPSYPVLIDPLGSLARQGSGAVFRERFWVGLAGAPGANGAVYGINPANTGLLVPRRNTLATATLQSAFATCALTDDLTYQPNGGAGQNTTDPATGLATPQPLGRQGRYTWAAVVHRPDNNVAHKATLKVLVFDGRPVGFAAAGDEVVLMNDPEPGNNVRFHAGADVPTGRSLTLLLPARGADQPPLLRRGGWVMLAVTEPPTVTPSGTFTASRPGRRKVSFHRVTGLTADDEVLLGGNNPLIPTPTPMLQYAGGPQMSVTPVAIDIDPPVPAEFTAPVLANSPPVATQVILLAGLSEVFDRPDLDASN